jgi:hypothetical protein
MLAAPVGLVLTYILPIPAVRAYAPSALTLWTFALISLAAAAAVARAFESIGRRRVALAATAGFMAFAYAQVIVDGIAGRSEDTAGAVAQLQDVIPPASKLVSFAPAHHLFAYHFGRPIELRDLPDADRDRDVTWFCYAAYGDARMPMPFASEIVAVVPVFRNRLPVPREVVVVGRRIDRPDDGRAARK